ncbi:MAG: hypothetical protein DRJ05_03030 [Bacteroidetes bacterium]|nr:MAG: hypothetical protein DRJ05_03030 [Bacteroidota bacterium]
MILICQSQTPIIQWQECYGTSEIDYNNAIVPTENGYLLGIGISTGGWGVSNYHGSHDIWLVKTDTFGIVVWEKCYGGSSAETPQKILRKSNNEFFIYGTAGSTDGDVQSGNNGSADLWVVKINGQGDIVWEKTYGCTVYDDPRDMVLTPDGGFVMIERIGGGGGDVSNFYGIGDVWMCKCDSLGNIEWEKTLGNEGFDNCSSMIINSEGNIMMIGAASNHGGLVECYPDEMAGDVWLVEIDLSGEIIWQQCYGGSEYDLGKDIEEIDNGYIFVASSFSDDGDVTGHHGSSEWGDFWIVKINYAGEILFQKSIGGYDVDSPQYVTQTEDGGIIAIGTTFSNSGDVSGNHSIPGYGEVDVWAVKLDQEGEIEWQQCYGGKGNEYLDTPHTILKKGDGNYVIASSSDQVSDDVQCLVGNFDYDAWVFEIKDCSQYPVGNIGAISGPDTVCTVYDSTNLYTIDPVTGAWYYRWYLSPEGAGTININGPEATVTWDLGWEGTANIVVMAMNDCDTTEWSELHHTEVFTCLGLEELWAGGVGMKVYPNPGRGFVVFEFSPPIIPPRGGRLSLEEGVVVIFDVFGQKVAELPITSEKTVWNTDKVKDGIYFYRVDPARAGEGEVLSGKVMVQE